MDEAKTSEPISRFQIVALLALACLNMQDGFDILAISYAAGAIAESWQIERSSLGIVLSAGLFGMMIGAMALSPFADKIGRRAITVLGLALSGTGMLIAALAPSIELLVLGRVITGLGIGAILASLNTLVAEFAGEKYRGRAIAIFQLGFPMGAWLSGFLVAWLLDIGSWRHVFAFGAASSFVFIPVMLLLPESMDFLAKSGRSDALTRINKTRKKLGWSMLDALPDTAAQANAGSASQSALGAVASLFTPKYIARTLLIWTAFFLLLTTLYFLLSWAPRIIEDMGFTAAQGNQGGRLINLVGMAGITVLGILGVIIRPSLLTSFYLLALSIALVVLGSVSGSFTITLLLMGAIGFFIHGSMIGLYATAPALYPAEMRATGMGWAIGLSRFGAVLGPASAGFFLDAGWTPQDLFKAYAGIALAAAAVVWFLWREEVRRAAD